MPKVTIFCDFDGTICIPDAVEFLLGRFAPPGWMELDERVWRGELSEREAMASQVSMLRVGWDEARAALLSGVRIREGFPEFALWCRDNRIPLQIVSSGLRPLIEVLLDSAGVNSADIHAHGAEISGDRWALIPYQGPRHADHCSHCKCDHLLRAAARGDHMVYIGDGYTDVCPSQLAHTLFACDALARECKRLNRPFHPYQTFFEVQQMLDSLLKSQTLPA